MNQNTNKILLASVVVSLASLASAQGVGGAVSGATSATTHLVPTVPPAPPAPPPPAMPPPPSVNASAAAQGAMSAATAVRPAPSATSTMAGANSAVGGSAAGVNATGPAYSSSAATSSAGHAAAATGVTPAVNASASGVDASASTHAATVGEVKGVAFGQDSTQHAGVSVNRDGAVARLHQATFTERASVIADAQSRVDASSAALTRLEARASQAGDRSRAEFAKLLVEARAREKEVRSSLREATLAAKEETWGKVQSELARDYGAYAEIVARAEATAGAGANTK